MIRVLVEFIVLVSLGVQLRHEMMKGFTSKHLLGNFLSRFAGRLKICSPHRFSSTLVDSEYAAKIRNFSICAHIDAGKTTLSECILYNTNEIRSRGDINEGTTAMDNMDQEKERGITIRSSLSSFNHQGFHFNFIDTPGHSDFTMSVNHSLRVIDGVIVLLDAGNGIETQTTNVWNLCERLRLPRIIFLNKLDRDGANYEACEHDIWQKYGKKCLPISIPYPLDSRMDYLINVLDETVVLFSRHNNEKGSECELLPINHPKVPSKIKSTFLERRDKLISLVAEADEELFLKYVSSEKVERDELIQAIRKINLKNDSSHIVSFCGSAKHNIGTVALLQGIIDFLPCPLDVDRIGLLRPYESDNLLASTRNQSMLSCRDYVSNYLVPSLSRNFSGIVFKIQWCDSLMNQYVYVRSFSGVIHEGEQLFNVRSNQKFSAQKLLLAKVGNTTKCVTQIGMGNFFLLKNTQKQSFQPGDTLLSIKENPPFDLMPTSVFDIPTLCVSSLEGETDIDTVKIESLIKKIVSEDNSIKSEKQYSTFKIWTRGELQMEIILRRFEQQKIKFLRTDFDVTYMENLQEFFISKAWLGEDDSGIEFQLSIHSFPSPCIKDTAEKLLESRQLDEYSVMDLYASKVTIEENNFLDKKIPLSTISSIETAARNSLLSGPILGSCICNVHIHIHSIRGYETFTKTRIHQALVIILRKIFEKKQNEKLMPIMGVLIGTDPQFVARITHEIIKNRHGCIIKANQVENSNNQQILSMIPLLYLPKFATKIESITKGTAQLFMHHIGYDTYQ